MWIDSVSIDSSYGRAFGFIKGKNVYLITMQYIKSICIISVYDYFQ